MHFDRQADFSFSKESQLYPIAGLVAAELNRQGKQAAAQMTPESSSPAESDGEFAAIKSPLERHHPYIVELLAAEAQVAAEDIVDFEIVLYDTQKACIGGLNNELIFSARLDNLGMTYCCAEALLQSTQAASSLGQESCIRLFASFDNEEIGSLTAQGANSSILPAVLKRLSVLGPAAHDMAGYATAYERTLASSFLVSADMAHAVNPNYAGKYEARHKPEMNGGTVLKINANARYTTNSPGLVLLQEAAQRARVPLQLFVVSNDSLCGGTIGPMLAAKLGARAVDVGNPQLSMHSIRETGGVFDVWNGVELLRSFLDNYGELERKILVD